VARVLTVPWDHSADCRLIPWTASVLWTQPGKRGLIIGQLRDSRLWVNGVPTVDIASPGYIPYPNVGIDREARDRELLLPIAALAVQE
jgi:hypothetical protein